MNRRMTSLRPYYHEFAWAYDLLQTDAVAPRVDFIETLLKRQGIESGATILDAGCGTGRYAIEFAKRGYLVFAVDRSPELLAVAQTRDHDAADRLEFMTADLLDATFSRPFDVVLCRGVLNDFVDDRSRGSVFRKFAAWLRPGGILIFDVREWTRTFARYRAESSHRQSVELPEGTLKFQSQTVLDVESHRLRIRERFDIDRCGAQTSIENDFVMRCWTSEEIAGYLSANGFETLGDYSTYGEDGGLWSDRLVIVARKRPGLPPAITR
jgi:SAM-dependent methyltransferase